MTVPAGPVFGRAGAAPVERAAAEFRRALGEGDSAFTPGREIWTSAHAAELMAAFVEQPDARGATFDDKLGGQLGGVSPGAVQLFAELYCLDLLPLSDYRGRTKRARLRVPLAIAGLGDVIPPVINEALDSGVINGGVAFKTRRYWQLSFLVEFAAGLLELPAGERRRLLNSPIEFRDKVDAVTTTNAPSQRHILLYLLFPAFFLPIAKSEHRSQIRAAFPDELGREAGDLDTDLRTIYDALVDSAGGPVDLYRPPYRQRWDPAAAESARQDPWEQFMRWAKLVSDSVDLDREERGYKIEMATRLGLARAALLANDDDWQSTLRSAIGYGNLLDSFFKMSFFQALRDQPARLRTVLTDVWQGEPDPQLFGALHSALRSLLAKGATPGNATALGSALLMSRDSARFPPYRPVPVEKARALVEHPSAGTSPSERYDDLLTLCDELLERAADHGVELQDRLDAQGLIWTVVSYDPSDAWSPEQREAFHRWRGDAAAADEPSSRRAWLIRGPNVAGGDLIESWRGAGFVSVAAASLREVEADVSRDDLKPIIDEDYAHTSYAQKAEKLDEFHAFLSRMQAGDIVATTGQGRLHLGLVTGPAVYFTSGGSPAALRRDVQWASDADGVDMSELPADLAARLQVQHDVVDLTQQIDSLDSLLVAPRRPVRPAHAPVELADPAPELAADLHVPREWLQLCVDLLKDRQQLIFYGPPGTGKTYLAQHLAAHIAGDNVRLVQFHPAYSYEDFFEGYRPRPEGGFALRPGPMRRIVDQASENPGVAYVLIIDEINRGNLAKIFGELYFLLEYRDQNIDLLYASDGDQGFSLPRNVYLIGTMNTADRSIALVDTAMRRRFAFVALHPSEPPTRDMLRSWLRGQQLPSDTAELLDELNARIDDEDFKVGPSYFMRRSVHDDTGLRRLWTSSILPLLEEHHYGELTRADVEQRYGLAAIAARVEQARRVARSEEEPDAPAGAD